MKVAFYRFTLSVTASLVLAACGGGSSTPADQNAAGIPASNEQNAAANQPPSGQNTAAAATYLSDCFTLTPGVKFSWPDGTKTFIIQEVFEGQNAFGSSEIRTNGTRFGTQYQTQSNGYLHLLGNNLYEMADDSFKSKDVYSSSAQIPLNMAVGDTVQLIYTKTSTRNFPVTSTTVTTESYPVTFTGLETLTLGGRTFPNTCKISSPDSSVAGQTSITWFAKGFGVIQQETRDAQGAPLANTRKALVTILSTPAQ